MFDIGWQELFVIAAIAIIVVGPRDLPRVLRTVMSVIRKARGMAREFQSGIDDVVREVELDDIRKEANSIASMDLEDEVKSALDPTGDLDREMNLDDVQKTMRETAKQMNATPARDDPPRITPGSDAAPDVTSPAPEPAPEPQPLTAEANDAVSKT